jgi:molybdate transport system regulatory protein
MPRREIENSPDEFFRQSDTSVEHLDSEQIRRLTDAFRTWFESAPSLYIRRVRGRYWVTFLTLRFTGARIGEVLSLNDAIDIDFSQGEIQITINTDVSVRRSRRVIPVPREIIAWLDSYVSEFPKMRGRVFALDQGNFRREFYKRAEEAEIPRELSHPHILRHTRAVELLRAGVPLPTVRDLLGHTLLSTTAMYLQQQEIAIRKILKEKGFL